MRILPCLDYRVYTAIPLFQHNGYYIIKYKVSIISRFWINNGIYIKMLQCKYLPQLVELLKINVKILMS